MVLKSIFVIIIGAIVQAIGVASLKHGMGNSSNNLLIIIFAFTLMVLGFFLYNIGLKRIKLSVAQPLFSTTLFFSCTLLSIFVMHDSIKINQIAGMMILLVGVFCVISSEKETQRGE